MRTKSYLSASALLLSSMLFTCAISSAQNNKGAQAGVLTQSSSSQAIHFDISPPLRDLAMRQADSHFSPRVTSPPLRPKLALQQAWAKQGIVPTIDTAKQTQTLAPVSATVGVNVLGVGVGFFGYSVPDAPTDVNLAVGDTQVVQWVNVQFAVFDKTTGANLLFNGQHFVNGNVLWSGFNGSCATSNSGDIIAQWDKIAHRWVLFQPVFSFPFASCFAISTSPDALGTYFRYQFPQNAGFPDYPKLGNWVDAYYTTQNMFNNQLTAYIGAQPCAFEKAKMLVGDPNAKMVCFFDDSNGTLFDDSMLPADIDSPELLPPAGTPEVLVGSIDNISTETHVYKYTMSVNFPAGTATLTGINGSDPITVNSYQVAPGTVPQLGTTSQLDTLSDRLMYRLAFRRTVNSANVPTNHYLVSHAIRNGSSAAQRWYEFRAPNSNLTNLTVFQQGTFAPDTTSRFMGSLAMDKKGNILMGYSRSSSAIHPDIYFTGRAPGDGLGTMQTEAPIVDQTVATGSQPDTSSRWGDYTSMSVDNDGCTMWYTNQYYTTTVRFNWSTRVASLKYNGCQ